MTRAALLFPLATLTPLPLIVAGAWWGGLWAAAALVYLTLFTVVLDEVAAATARPGEEFPAAPALSVALAVAHFGLLATVVPALGGAAEIGTAAWLASFGATGLYLGQVSNANAHELIHGRSRLRFQLGRWVYISLLFGHHASAHLLVHHRCVATPEDPNSAPRGMSFYRFFPRAWAGSFRAGLAAENARHRAAFGKIRPLRHPYTVYVSGGAAFAMAAGLLGGATGLAVFLALAIWAQAQLLLSDYVQHYALRRDTAPHGRPEPVRPAHSWNAPHWFSAYLMLNAPRHSDHHAHPAKPYPALELTQDTPTLPYSLPVMCTLALFPPRWRRLMDRRAEAWRRPELRTAAE